VDLAALAQLLDSMILEVFSNPNNSTILEHHPAEFIIGKVQLSFSILRSVKYSLYSMALILLSQKQKLYRKSIKKISPFRKKARWLCNFT